MAKDEIEVPRQTHLAHFIRKDEVGDTYIDIPGIAAAFVGVCKLSGMDKAEFLERLGLTWDNVTATLHKVQ